MSALAVGAEVEEVQCVVIPLQDARLLLPNECVAEILPWRRIKPLQAVPSWCLGILGWRGETIPVVRFEVLNEHEDARSEEGRCIVVMNRAKLPIGPSFYAFAAEGLPRLMQVNSDDMAGSEPLVGPADTAAIKLGTELVQIPDLEMVERQVLALGIGR